MSSEVSHFSFPTTVIAGAGALQELPTRLKQLDCRRPLVVTDPGLLQTKAFQNLSRTLGEEKKGKSWHLFHGVHPNPVEKDVKEAAHTCRQSKCDSVIAFGGGSALDVGKACRLLIKRPQLSLARFNSDEDWTGLLPCICIPTTAGTGSEVGRSSVITPEGKQRRSVVFHPNLLAALVILDAELTLDLPALLTAATGMDALTHCIESFTSPVFHPFCEGIALEGVHLIIENLPRAYKEGRDQEARGKMLVAAAMGGVAFQKDLGATHSLAHPLSALHGMHHGTANAICLAHVMELNAKRKPGLYRRLGLACGLDLFKLNDYGADAVTIDFIQRFIAALGLDQGLRAYGVDESHIDALAEQAYQDTCHRTNPVPVTRKDLKSLYIAAL